MYNFEKSGVIFMDIKKFIKNLYLDFDYILRNPSLPEEDSPWKGIELIPVLDISIKMMDVIGVKC